MTTKTYAIGGYSADMTEAQAARWNTGKTTAADLRAVKIHDATPQTAGDVYGRHITLRRATNDRLEPTIAAALAGARARLTR